MNINIPPLSAFVWKALPPARISALWLVKWWRNANSSHPPRSQKWSACSPTCRTASHLQVWSSMWYCDIPVPLKDWLKWGRLCLFGYDKVNDVVNRTEHSLLLFVYREKREEADKATRSCSVWRHGGKSFHSITLPQSITLVSSLLCDCLLHLMLK